MKFGSFPCHHRDSYKQMSEVLNPKGVYICDKARRYVEIAENVIDIGAIEQLAKSIALITKNKRKQWEKIGTDLRYMAMGETFFGDQNESRTTDLEDRLIKRKEKVSFYAAGGLVTGYVVKVSFEAMQNVKVIDLVIEFKTTFGSNQANRYGYHAIVRCFGWNSDRTLSQNIQPEWHTKGKLKKYPKTTSVFQSTNINNLYYAGALTHGRDFRKAAGGFIHGFRYNAQVLFHALEWKHHNVPWPSVQIPLRKTTDRKRILNEINKDKNEYFVEDQDVDNLLHWFEYRMNNGDGTYQMFGQLVDACVFFIKGQKEDSKSKETTIQQSHVRCMKEIPKQYLQIKFGNRPRISLEFIYGANHHGPKVFEIGAVGATEGDHAEKSTFLHPKLMFFQSHTNESEWNHHLVEDVPTKFDTTQHRPYLKRYLKFVLSRIEWTKSGKKIEMEYDGNEGENEGSGINDVAVSSDGDVEQVTSTGVVGVFDEIEQQYQETLLETFHETDRDKDLSVSNNELDVDMLFNLLRSFDEDGKKSANNVMADALVNLFDYNGDGKLQSNEYVGLMEQIIGKD